MIRMKKNVMSKPGKRFYKGWEDEWDEWYHLTPLERWKESQKLWDFFVQMGGSLDPEPDSQSPFDITGSSGSVAPHGRAGLRILRRSGI